MALTKHSQRNLNVILNFLLYANLEDEYTQTAHDYIAEDHVDGEGSEEAISEVGRYILLTGNITFHHFEADELALFKTDKENKALIHDLGEILFFKDKEEAYKIADEAESYILVQDFTGEMVFEKQEDELRFNIECK
jgi:hypothetical protein